MNARIDPSTLLPTLADIEAAAQVVYRDFAATPQYRWGLLTQRRAPTAGSSTRTTHLWVRSRSAAA